MFVINSLQGFVHHLAFPSLFIVGLMTFLGYYGGKIVKNIKLPSIIGFMFVGALLGPSLVDLLDHDLQEKISFITEVSLGFVALSIGLELSFKELKRQGKSIILIIFSESFLAFIIVLFAVYFFTRNLPLALIFGAVAPASAPAGTVAVIHEYKAKGKLTSALYSVVGFDDGLGIIIFGFASAIAKNLLANENGGASESILKMLEGPFVEIILSVLMGLLIAFFVSIILKKNKSAFFILIFSSVLITTGISIYLHLSLILTNMVMGIVIVNSQSVNMVDKIKSELKDFMPLLFVMFFVLAGANLHINALPSLGVLGAVYIAARTSGLMGGSYLGAVIGKADSNIRKYLGMGILSQAGVAIGLSLIVKHEFIEFGAAGEFIGSSVITTITATCIFFEIIGPILTKIGLEKAGEIKING